MEEEDADGGEGDTEQVPVEDHRGNVTLVRRRRIAFGTITCARMRCMPTHARLQQLPGCCHAGAARRRSRTRSRAQVMRLAGLCMRMAGRWTTSASR